MKKLISIVLTLFLVFSLLVPAFASGGSSYRSTVPMILISGDGDTIYKTEGEEEIPVFKPTDFAKLFLNGDDEGEGEADESEEDSSVSEAAKNILLPLLLEGVLQDKWDNYYDALYKEISDLFSDIMLDGDGNPQNNTDISGYHRWCNGDAMWWGGSKAAEDGTFGFEDYHFWYDWRLDPLKIADELNDYINAVKDRTGAQKVAVTSRCLGSTVLLAYISKYGTGSLQGAGFDGTTSNGSEAISGALSGKFSIDGNSISRFLDDSDAFDLFSIDPLVASTLELLENSGVMDRMTDAARKLIYLKIEKGVVSALARATMFTMPCYWALVKAEDFEKAKEYVFGPEGSEKREQYAGLITKIDNYHNQVRLRIPELLDSVHEGGSNLCVISKYGAQIVPIIKDADLVADQYASVTSSSFGATTAKIGETLSEKYIAEKEGEGKSKYISPDRQIDASTCMFPEYTWFVKGIRHSEWATVEGDIMERVLTADRQLTVDELEYGRFIVAFTGSDDWETMTEENCNTENWSDTSSAKPKTKAGRLAVFIESLIKWLKIIFEKLVSKSGGD